MERLSEHHTKQVRGHEFAKYCWLLAKHAKTGVHGAEAEAERFSLTAPGVARVLKSAVAAATTVDPGWASELSAYRGLTQDWVDVFSRETILGKIQAVRVPFFKKVITETGAFSAGWVDVGQPIPMSRATFSAPSMLQRKKVGVMVPFLDELFESWSAATEANVLDSITRATIYGSDHAALDPSIAATDAQPASLTNGIAMGQSTGSSAAQVTADLKAMVQQLIDGGSDLSRVVIAMSPSTALYLSQLLNAGNVHAFPDMRATGGAIWGVPVIVTTAAVQVGSPTSHIVAAIDGKKLLVADDGLVLVEASSVASLQFSDAPSNGPTSLVNLYQTGARVVRVVHYLNFERAHDSAVAWFAVAY